MEKQDFDISNEVSRLFRKLGKTAQVETLAELYWSMSDGQKDDFLRETENE